MEKAWYKKTYFRNLVDMHINNGDERLLEKFDTEAYADNLLKAGFDTAYIYASNCLGLCLYPSKIGYLHQIAKKRDIFGETVTACRKRGLHVIGYLNNWTTAAYNNHPEWRVNGADGKGSRDTSSHGGRYGVCCFNSPYSEMFEGMVSEICQNYDIDGLWVDMVGFWRGVCKCEFCREKYYTLTGKNIPVEIDWTSSDWVSYVKFKERSLNEYAQRISVAARRSRAEISVSIQCAGWKLGSYLGFNEEYYFNFDYASGDFYGNLAEQAVDSKFLYHATSNQPFEYMVSRCPDLVYHTMSRPFWQLRQQAFASVLHGGSFMIIDAIDPKGTMNPYIYEEFREIKRELERFWSEDRYDGHFVSDIAVYTNYDSFINLSDCKKSADSITVVPPLISRLSSMAKTFAREKLSFDILTRKNLDKLNKYGLVILSEIPVLSIEEVKVLDMYVKNGGTLYVSGKTGIIDSFDSFSNCSESLLRNDSIISEITGVSLVGSHEINPVYLSIASNSNLFSKSREDYPYSTLGPVPQITAAEGNKVLATITLPISSHENPSVYVSAISDPPWEKTDFPALTQNKVGSGFCFYSAALIEADEQPEMTSFFGRLVKTMLGARPLVEIDAPCCVEYTVKQVNDSLKIMLLNTLYEQTQAVMPEITIKIPISIFDINETSVIGSIGSDPISRFIKNEAVIKLSGMREFVQITCK